MIRSPNCTFWELLDLDNTDLSVIVAGDICEGVIDFKDYLQFFDHFEYITRFRFCLLLGYDNKELYEKSDKELFALSEEGLHRRFNFYKPGDWHMREYLLQLIQYPFAQWGSGCLEIQYSSIDFLKLVESAPLDVDQLMKMLQEKFKFKYFVPFRMMASRPIFTIGSE